MHMQDTRMELYICGLEGGDAPRRVPRMSISDAYKYVGMATRLDGKHLEPGLARLEAKVREAGATPNRTLISCPDSSLC